ncbi:Coniferyl aldehyde dehydrogenase [Dickeya solani]|uniref:Aldehyde dehydrogenase n=2 Tax=Dickeya solani TaxID=1089444 RepID=A0AAV3KGD5_9GAMM|nr:coniferyl aldehyde dehydrogenase [Dickeya solani]ANE76011.1 aldehyde dehydrogenase [Dickeya solani IPO 2222]AUC43542.1 Aldehyde dehydrogenase [Dickeya solani RNS 08.23.3.1.A]AUH08580.1 aldehyde dehydrogenase [Dickeya solani D s0432-1]AUH12576.1 aldehyde dehydrogenase [Dickeya solani]AYQ46453.1 Coniferyl aldehyde dehydrogenase [Dickeya solani]
MNHFILNNQPVSADVISQHLSRMQAVAADCPLTIPERISILNRCIELLKAHQDELCEAYSQDFGYRAPGNTLISDILGSIDALRHSARHLEQWAEEEQRISPFPGTRVVVEYKPLGVIGVMSPWNFPLVLTFGPLAGVIAAGNRAMIKPSELAENGSRLLCRLIAERFAEDEISTLQGGVEASKRFSSLPFDHLVFTGSTATGRQVMKAAAENLTPVTLELGGKSPVIVSHGSDIVLAAQRIMTVKTFNAGQICIAPDYVLVHRDDLPALVEQACAFLRQTYGTFIENREYTSVINARQTARLKALLDDARNQGATLVCATAEADDLSHRRMAPTLVINPPLTARIMQEEIFGPLLPVIAYDHIEQCLTLINGMDRPLATYYFGDNQQEIAQVRQHTLSGALVINDVMSHVLVHDIPFGGVGASGMGAYHGDIGFKRFSHARPVFYQSSGGESNLLMRAPFDEVSRRLVAQLIDGDIT